MKINKTNTIISLTGSNPLHHEAIMHIKKTGILVFLDIDINSILARLYKMKVNRIVGQSSKSLPDILEWRRSKYEKYYDIRVVIEDNESVESIANRIVDLIKKNQEFISTRGFKKNYFFLDVIREGLAQDRGLFVPQYLPSISLKQIKRMIEMSYEERYIIKYKEMPENS